MTARRRSQIDATHGLDYLGSQSPVGLNITQLRSLLDSFYAAHAKEVRERRRKAAAAQYRRYAADPEWKKRDREKKEVMRSNMTPEQKQATLDYAKYWYQRKKKLSEAEAHIEKTA